MYIYIYIHAYKYTYIYIHIYIHIHIHTRIYKTCAIRASKGACKHLAGVPYYCDYTTHSRVIHASKVACKLLAVYHHTIISGMPYSCGVYGVHATFVCHTRHIRVPYTPYSCVIASSFRGNRSFQKYIPFMNI